MKVETTPQSGYSFPNYYSYNCVEMGVHVSGWGTILVDDEEVCVLFVHTYIHNTYMRIPSHYSPVGSPSCLG